MLKNYDESELLDLIEGRLDAGKAAALEARLAGDVPARLLIERMRADRAALRSLPEPELPMDFLAQSEHLLARPMLMEPVGEPMALKPGQYRRQQQKLRWRVRWPRLAAAALVLLALGAGAWQLTMALWPQRGAEQPMLAVSDSAMEVSGVGDGAGAVNVRELRGEIHHALPSEQAVSIALASRNGDDAVGRMAAARASGAAVDAQFALVIRTGDGGAAEAAISRLVTESAERCALVRNFSFEEARRLDREWRVAHAGRSGSPQPNAVADVRGSGAERPKVQWKELADHVREHLRASTPSANGSKEPVSGCVAGAKDLSPTLEQQLDLSSRGATHVIVLSVGELQGMLGELGMDASQTTSLRTLPEQPAISDATTPMMTATLPPVPALEAWLSDGPRVRKAMADLAAQGPQTLVRLPVVIEIGDSRR